MQESTMNMILRVEAWSRFIARDTGVEVGFSYFTDHETGMPHVQLRWFKDPHRMNIQTSLEDDILSGRHPSDQLHAERAIEFNFKKFMRQVNWLEKK